MFLKTYGTIISINIVLIARKQSVSGDLDMAKDTVKREEIEGKARAIQALKKAAAPRASSDRKPLKLRLFTV